MRLHASRPFWNKRQRRQFICYFRCRTPLFCAHLQVATGRMGNWQQHDSASGADGCSVTCLRIQSGQMLRRSPILTGAHRPRHEAGPSDCHRRCRCRRHRACRAWGPPSLATLLRPWCNVPSRVAPAAVCPNGWRPSCGHERRQFRPIQESALSVLLQGGQMPERQMLVCSSTTGRQTATIQDTTLLVLLRSRHVP